MLKKLFYLSFIVPLCLFLFFGQTEANAQGTSYCSADFSTCVNNCDPCFDPVCQLSPAPGSGIPTCYGSTTPSECKPSVFCGNEVQTAFGKVPIQDTTQLFAFFLKWGIGIAGGIAFLLIILASIQITTSTGDPKRLQAGKELLTAAIAGVMFLLFSIFILRIIGIEVLNLNIFI